MLCEAILLRQVSLQSGHYKYLAYFIFLLYICRERASFCSFKTRTSNISTNNALVMYVCITVLNISALKNIYLTNPTTDYVRQK